MIETNFEKNKSLALLIKKYKELLKDRNVFIEDHGKEIEEKDSIERY